MNQNEIITAVVALMVCGVLVGVTAIPLIAGISQETITEEYNDESNAGWLRMAYDNKPFDVEITADGDNITAGGQTGLNDDMILYADASACVMCVNGAFVIVNGYAATPEVINASTVAITNADGSLTVEADGDTVITATSPAWAYYPDATGKYAYFGADVDGVKIKASDNHAYAGTFAGVWAYNNVVVAPADAGDLGLSLNAVVEDGAVNSVTWGVETGVNPTLNYTYQTPNYNDWSYTVWSGGVRVTAYNGAVTGTVIIPDKGYVDSEEKPLRTVGYSSNLITDSNLNDNAKLVLPTVTYSIATNTFANCTKFTGDLVIPEGCTAIGLSAFKGCTGFEGALLLPSTLTIVANTAFNGCTGFNSLIVLSTPTYTNLPFSGCSFDEVLNIGGGDFTNAGLTADEIRSDIPAMGYIAPLSTTAVVTKEGAVYDLMTLLPLIMVLGVVMMGVYAVGTRYA